MTCIFGNADQWASASYHYPEMVERIAKYEEEFGVTIKRKESVRELLDSGTPFDDNPKPWGYYAQPEVGYQYLTSIIEEGEWILPPGALSGNNAGPT
jgi:hypothetical protein